MPGPDRRIKAGPQQNAKTSRLLGPRDPRWDRNARIGTTVFRTGPGIEDLPPFTGQVFASNANMNAMRGKINAILDALRRGQIIDKVPQ